MAHTIDIRCPECGDLIAANETSPIWLLSLGRVNLEAACSKCGFRKKYRFLTPSRVERMMGEGLEIKEERYPELLEENLRIPKEAEDNPQQAVTPDEEGWVRCPACGFRFKPNSAQHFDGRVHKRCGQRLCIEQA